MIMSSVETPEKDRYLSDIIYNLDPKKKLKV